MFVFMRSKLLFDIPIMGGGSSPWVLWKLLRPPPCQSQLWWISFNIEWKAEMRLVIKESERESSYKLAFLALSLHLFLFQQRRDMLRVTAPAVPFARRFWFVRLHLNRECTGFFKALLVYKTCESCVHVRVAVSTVELKAVVLFNTQGER